MKYQIIDWNKTFENNKSRERDRCGYVCLPNKQDGMGFSLIMNEPDGASIYGIWCLIVGSCSRQLKPRDGWLTDDGHPTGTPWALSALAVRWRRNEAEIVRAIEFLCSPKIGWIRAISDAETSDFTETRTPDGRSAGTCRALSAPSRASEEEKGIEENRREKNPEIPPAKAVEVRSVEAKPISVSEEGLVFADEFRATLPTNVKLTSLWREKWAKCYDDLIRIDKRSPRAISAVCGWARKDPFWSANFMSPMKLRDKNRDGVAYFDVFSEAMKRRSNVAANSADRKSANSHREYQLKPEEGPRVWNPLTDEEDDQ